MPVENIESDTQPHSRTGQPAPPSPANVEPGDSARAILSEIEECASRFSAVGEEASIDLRCLKARPGERDILVNLLGRGEVSAVVDSIDHCEIHETSVPCVWWVRRWNEEGETVGDSIEITDVPDVLLGDRKAVVHGLEILRIAWPFRMQCAAPAGTHPENG